MDEDLSLLGCDAVLGEWFLTFLRIVVPPSSWVQSMLHCLTLAEEDNTILKTSSSSHPALQCHILEALSTVATSCHNYVALLGVYSCSSNTLLCL